MQGFQEHLNFTDYRINEQSNPTEITNPTELTNHTELTLVPTDLTTCQRVTIIIFACLGMYVVYMTKLYPSGFYIDFLKKSGFNTIIGEITCSKNNNFRDKTFHIYFSYSSEKYSFGF